MRERVKHGPKSVMARMDQLCIGDGVEVDGQLWFVFDTFDSGSSITLRLSKGFWNDGDELTNYTNRHNHRLALRHRVDFVVAHTLYEEIVSATAAGRQEYRDGLSRAFRLVVDETEDGLAESVQESLSERQ